MDTALFDYLLPPERIAQTPAEPRDAARLLVVERATRRIEHRVFRDLPGLLPANTRLFRNSAAVFKARLRLPPKSGGLEECLLLHPELGRFPAGNVWWCLLKPGRKFPPGAGFGVEKMFSATVVEKTAEGQVLVRFEVHQGTVTTLAEHFGQTPLPPYIRRTGDGASAQLARDISRYQTVYADPEKKIAAAAPTAGLHFTPAVLAELTKRGVRMFDVALRVGLDTFRPITVEKLEQHVIHREWYEIPAATRAAIATHNGPALAVGTTTLRALEDYGVKTGNGGSRGPALPVSSLCHGGPSSARPEQVCVSGLAGARPSTNETWTSEANIFIYPPRRFVGADILLTNFHLPRSTLMCLVSAFLTPGSTDGIAWLKEIYADAIARNYRFYSYGDAMLIL